jgi:Domain of unknown function (DUF1844)
VAVRAGRGETMAEEPSFKVTDRRRGQDVSSPAEGEVPSGEGAPPPTSPSQLDAGPGAEPSRTERPQVDASAGEPSEGAGDLSGLFVMLASSALVNLGEAADPASGEQHVDLEQARDAIDILAVLRDKTRGNLTGEESQLLEDILYDLQMRFVRATGR